MRRSDQRRDAAVALYQRDVTARPLAALLEAAKPFTRDLAEGADANLAAIDAEIGANAHGWTIQRIAPLERAIMRIAVFEIHHRPEIPVAVSIDEAVSIVKRYCGTEAPGFVNGVLSAIARGAAAGDQQGEIGAAERMASQSEIEKEPAEGMASRPKIAEEPSEGKASRSEIEEAERMASQSEIEKEPAACMAIRSEIEEAAPAAAQSGTGEADAVPAAAQPEGEGAPAAAEAQPEPEEAPA